MEKQNHFGKKEIIINMVIIIIIIIIITITIINKWR